MSFGSSPSYSVEDVPEKQYVKAQTEAITSARNEQKERSARLKGLRGTLLSKRSSEMLSGSGNLGGTRLLGE